MGVLISSANFVGKYAIPQDSFSDLDGFIDNYEVDLLVDLLGYDLYTAFEADLAGTPQVPASANYLTIYNKLTLDHNCVLLRSKGMVDMLLGFIFFEYMRQIKYKATTQGIVFNAPDSSVVTAYGSLYKYYNDSVATHKAIQAYICYKEADYPVKFNGIQKDYAIPIFQ